MIGFLAAGLIGPLVASVIVEDTTLPMERGYDGLECLWNNGRSVVTNYGNSVEITSPKSVRSLHLAYSPGNTPGPRPFRGGPIVLESEGACTGKVAIRISGLRGGKELEFVESWNSNVCFQTGLDPKDRYVIRRITFSPNANADWKVHIKRVCSRVRLPAAEACRLDVETGNPLHLCRDGDGAPVVRIINESVSELAFSGRIAYADLCGHKKEFPFATGILAAGQSARYPLEWPLPGRGLWIVGAEVRSDDGSSAVHETRFAVIDRHEVTPALPDGKFRLGVNYHMQRYSAGHQERTLDALVFCGAKLVRAGIDAAWNHVQEKGRGEWEWGKTDRMLAMIEQRGLAVDTIIWGTPKWAAQPDRLADKKLSWWSWANGMPADVGDFEGFCERLSGRYGTRIAYYELGNEWDFLGSNILRRTEMTEATKAGCRGIKRGNPNAKVIPNGWACWDSKNSRVQEKGMPEGVMTDCHGLYDAHAFHNHGPFRTYRENTLDALERRNRLGIDDVPWFANETALSCVNGNEIPVAEHVWMKILFAWAHGSRDYAWYNLRATGWDPKDPEQGYGMMTPDYYPRASYAAFSALATVLSGYDADGILKSERTREVYRFRGMRKGKAEKVMAGWDTALRQPATLRVRTDAAKAAVVDFMGNVRRLAVVEGCVRWPLERRPTALVLHDARMADAVAEDLDLIHEENAPVVRLGCEDWRGRPSDFVVDKVWQQHGGFEANPLTVDRVWSGPDDCSFRGWLWLDAKSRLCVRVEVRDDVHSQRAKEVRKMSEGDCLRVSVVIPGAGCNWELGFRRTDEGADERLIWNAPGDADRRRRAEALVEFSSERTDGLTTYSAVVPLEAMDVPLEGLSKGVAVSVKVDDSDGMGRDLWMGLELPMRLVLKENGRKK